MKDVNVEKLRTDAEGGSGCKVSQALNSIASMEERLLVLKQMTDKSQNNDGLHQLHLSEKPEGSGLNVSLQVELSRDVSPPSGQIQQFLSKYVWAKEKETLYTEKHFYLNPDKDGAICHDR